MYLPYTELDEFSLHLDKYLYIYNVFLISEFDCVLIVVLFLLEGSPASEFYVGGPKRNQKRSLVGGPAVVRDYAARCLLHGPFCISLPTRIVKCSCGAT
jgi:hypothetical protein